MTPLNEIEKTKEEIKVLETKLSLLEKIEKHKKSPAEEAYKRVFGKYPGDGFSWTVEDERCWHMFRKGYDYAYEKTVSKCQPTPLEKLKNANWYVDAKTLLKSNWETTRVSAFRYNEDDGLFAWLIEHIEDVDTLKILEKSLQSIPE